jgi:oligopeptidase B
MVVFHEKDEQYIVGINKSASGKYIFITAASGLTSEIWVLDGLESISDPKLFQKRELNHKYDVEHLGTQFLILTNGGGKYLNNKLCACPLVIISFYS